MTRSELKQLVKQGINEPFTLGRLACVLRDNDLVEQQHHDARTLVVFWRDAVDFCRCTIFLDEDTELCLAQVDLHKDSTVRMEMYEPCSITVSPSDNLLCLTRIRH
jgi:hypothetical protein